MHESNYGNYELTCNGKINHPINKEELNGQYQVKLLIDEKIYQTGITINLGKKLTSPPE